MCIFKIITRYIITRYIIPPFGSILRSEKRDDEKIPANSVIVFDNAADIKYG